MFNAYDLKEFKNRKREKLLDYKVYENNFKEVLLTFDALKKSFEQPAETLQKIPPANFMSATRLCAWDAIDHLASAYSAGHSISDLRTFYPIALGYFDTYSIYSKKYNDSSDYSNSHSAHLALSDVEYVKANQLVCFGILLGWGSLLHRLMPLLDYNNPERDGLLERLLGFYVSDRGTPPDECTRHLPYFKTLKIFSAPVEERSELMAGYLEEWYDASRREPYYDSHKRHESFKGYWSWEAAAITYLLDIDDSSYADAQFYPKDMVAFARSTQSTYAPVCTPPVAGELRAKAGEPCPKAGQWQSLDTPAVTRTFNEGELMADLRSVYGLTVWRYAEC